MAVAASQTLIQLKNILFATDFSTAADHAAAYAAEIAKHYGAKLFVLHVRPPLANPMTAPSTWKGAQESEWIEEQQQRRDLLRKFAAVQPEILIKEGDLWSNLETAVVANKIDLIVLGTRGRSGIGRFLLGSAAEMIFRRALCPVLTVGPRASDTPSQHGEISRILFATDFSPESMRALPYAISLAQENQAYLTLLHVIEDPKVGELVKPDDLATLSEQYLRDLVRAEAKLWCVPEYVVEQGAPAEKILDVAARHKTELIVLGVRRPDGMYATATHIATATAHEVVCHSTCPVLTVRG